MVTRARWTAPAPPTAGVTTDLGSLGDGSTGYSAVPVAVDTSGVLAGKTLTQISAGDYDVCAVDSGGAAYCWGANTGGELGDGSTAASDVPVLAGPQAPTGVTASPGDTTATVSWTAPGSLDGGTLTRYTATAAPGTAGCTTTGATSCTLTGLTDGTTYTITVEADTTVGDSGASPPATVTPVHSGGGRPVFTSPPAVTAAYGARLAFTITAAGSPPPRITHSAALAETGPLPVGLALTSKTHTAVIAGTPAAGTAGRYPITITAASSSGKATTHLTITVTQHTQ